MRTSSSATGSHAIRCAFLKLFVRTPREVTAMGSESNSMHWFSRRPDSLAREVIVQRAGSSHPEECEKPNDLPFLRYESAFRDPWAVSPSPPRVLRFSSQSFHV